MQLLFGRNRAMLAAHEVLRDFPRLPLSLQPLQGDLAAATNNATRGYDIGQANPIWVSEAVWGRAWGAGHDRDGLVGPVLGAVCVVISAHP